MSVKKRLVIILTVIVGLILFGMLISGIGSGNTTKTAKNGVSTTKAVNVTDFASINSKVVVTIDGRINGDDVHRAIRITISRDSRTAEVIQGYENKVIKSQTDTNNQSAYTDFVYAISRYGFSKERKTTQPDDRGACPLGQRYIYEIYDDDNQVMRRWSASCGSIGTSAVSSSQVNDLFQKQVTDYFKFVSGVQL